MKLDKSKCRDPKCYCRNEQESLPSMSDMQACIGTGEVVGNSEQLKSRSVQRREALQKGEPMPEFDKPEMPERIWAKDFPEANQPTGKMGGWVEWSDTTQTAYLRADKVRELVRLHEDFRDLLLKYRFTPGVPDELNAKAEEIDNLQSALFPEGVEGKEEK